MDRVELHGLALGHLYHPCPHKLETFPLDPRDDFAYQAPHDRVGLDHDESRLNHFTATLDEDHLWWRDCLLSFSMFSLHLLEQNLIIVPSCLTCMSPVPAPISELQNEH